MKGLLRFFAALLSCAALFVLLPCLSVPAGADVGADGKIVIVLDAGHGGIDGGTAVGRRTEKENNLIIAKYLAEILGADERFRVILTRDTDVLLNYYERVRIARENNADLFLSLHCNSSPEHSANGTMAFVSVVDRYAAWDLAGKMLDEISASLPIRRGRVEVRRDNGSSKLGYYYWDSERQWDMPGAANLGMVSDYYSVTTFSSKFGIPSIIMEHGYCSNANDDALLSDDASLRNFAEAEARAIVAYYTGHEHVWGEVETDFPSNCLWHGTASRRCEICGAKSGTTDLPAAPENHFWRILESRPATCTEEGWVKKICQIESNVHYYTKEETPAVEEILPPAGHSFDILADVEAGHGQDGHLYKRCTVCGYEEEETVPGEPHDYKTTEEVLPTCTAPGHRTTRCTLCGDIVEETLPSPGHRYELKESKPASPEEDGYELWVCPACGAEKREALSACPHEFTVEEIPATCGETGAVVSTCALCGYVKTDELPALGHRYETQLSDDPTCTEGGYYKGKCAICGDVISRQIPAAGHHFVSGTCSICGASESGEGAGEKLSPGILWAVGGVVAAGLCAMTVLLLRQNREMVKHRQKFGR